jgi:hypothetical protein
MADINLEQRVLKKNLTWELVKDLRQWAPRVEENVKTRFRERWEDTKSRRLDAVMNAIKTRTFSSKNMQVNIGVGKIQDLDAKTVLSRMDRAFPQYHYTPFLKKGKIRKKIGQPSKNNYHLWRILESRESQHQTIYGNMWFTSRLNDYSSFIFAKKVTNWQLRENYWNRRFYFLTSQRTIYDEDRHLMYRLFSALVKKQIFQTRFSPRLSTHIGGMRT